MSALRNNDALRRSALRGPQCFTSRQSLALSIRADRTRARQHQATASDLKSAARCHALLHFGPHKRDVVAGVRVPAPPPHALSHHRSDRLAW
eukprot:942551-Rhodomonas_salina.2